MFNKATAFVIILALLVGPISFTSAQSPGVDDLRGRWDIEITFNTAETISGFFLFINNSVPAETLDTFVASGCIQTPYSAQRLPAAIQAEKTGTDAWAIDIVSTMQMADWVETAHFEGIADVGSVNGIADEQMSGAVYLGAGIASWTAEHHDRRQTTCPPVEVKPPLYFWADVYTHHSYDNTSLEWSLTVLEGYTNITSSAMLVMAPDGTEYLGEPFTDIFSPFVDFVTEFRFMGGEEGSVPIAGQEYTFTLLDITGEPIPGTTQTDIWYGCQINPPRGLTASLTSNMDIDVIWEPIDSVPNVFEPEGPGSYQLTGQTISADTTGYFGAHGIQDVWHRIPWNPFGGENVGYPDGTNVGESLSEFSDGPFWIWVAAFSQADPSLIPSGQGAECGIWDSTEYAIFEKTGDTIIEIPAP